MHIKDDPKIIQWFSINDLELIKEAEDEQHQPEGFSRNLLFWVDTEINDILGNAEKSNVKGDDTLFLTPHQAAGLFTPRRLEEIMRIAGKEGTSRVPLKSSWRAWHRMRLGVVK